MSKWTGKKSPVNLPRGRRDSASINISHFHKGIPVWIENTYEEKSSHYRSTLLPVNYSTRPTFPFYFLFGCRLCCALHDILSLVCTLPHWLVCNIYI